MWLWIALGCSGVPTQAEVTFSVSLTNTSAPGDLVPPSTGDALDVMFAPGILVVHGEGFRLFEQGAAASPELETLAEDGDNEPMLAALEGDGLVSDFTSFAAFGEDYSSAPVLPGEVAKATVTARPGDQLSFASMFAASNDLFIGLPQEGLALFDGETAVSGELRTEVALYDAGTEVNQEPGTGADQPGRQAEHGAGTAENGVVEKVGSDDGTGFVYPTLTDWVILSVVPQAAED